ncbi:hypothetical protein [Streptomyces sp. NPDC090022]|uniref:hypothetical protein n=1 Tax=Streptomyces sp. NPDC090022 TaxID=3365920 RepID=UPI0037F6F148
MTVPNQHNPYGVRVPTKKQGLKNVASPPRDDHPLVPWSEAGHSEQWVDVDHAKAQVDVFRKWLDTLPEVVDGGVDHGCLVVVTGPIGMGKTSLIHRCVHEAREYIGRLNPEPPLKHFVAMTAGYGNNGRAISTDDDGNFAPTRLINSRILKQIVGELRKQQTKVDAGLPKEPPGDAFTTISELLEAQDALLFVIVPHIAWKDTGARTRFLKTCLSHARSRIVLFVEVSLGEAEEARHVTRELRHPAVTHLALGHLKDEDRVTFHQSARSGHPDPDASLLTGWEPTDVRELRQVYHAVAEHQIRNEQPVRITAEHLRQQAEALNQEARRRLLGEPSPDPDPEPAPDPDPDPDPAPDPSGGSPPPYGS